MTDIERQHWEANRGFGLRRYLLRRFIAAATVAGTMGVLQAFLSGVSTNDLPWRLALGLLGGIASAVLLVLYDRYRWNEAERASSGRRPFDVDWAIIIVVGGGILTAFGAAFWWLNWRFSGSAVSHTVGAAVCGALGVPMLIGGAYWAWVKINAVLSESVRGMGSK
jgi:hypothetical protein